MADEYEFDKDNRVREITLNMRQEPFWMPSARMAVFFTLLTLATGIPRVLFGGAFLIDLIIFIIIVAWVIAMARRWKGWDVKMTQQEIIMWAGDGAPLDVKKWREDHFKEVPKP